MNNWKLLVLALPLAAACGDKEIESEPSAEASSEPSAEASSEPGSEPSVEEPDLVEAVAVGFELFSGWNQDTNELLGWQLDDGTIQDPYVLITLATMDYFSSGSDATVETCELFATFSVDETAGLLDAELFNWNTGVGGSGDVVAPWENASFQGYLEIIGQSTETNCDNFDPSVFPLGGMYETFNLMHFGVAFAGLSTSPETEEWISGAWDEDGNGTLDESEEAEWLEARGSFMAQYIAMNHPNSSAEDGYDFIGYDWNYGRAFQFDADTQDIPTEECEDDPSQQCFIPAALYDNQGTNVVWISSGAKWYEDFPNFDLEGLQAGNGIPDSNE